jgi:hypothetical protein
LLLCAKHLFVAAMVAWVHPGLPPIRKSEHDGGATRVPLSPEAIEDQSCRWSPCLRLQCS